MAAIIPEAFQDLLQKKAFAHLATVMADGSPQVTPVWVDFDGTYVRVNSAKGRVKDKNMRRTPRVALAIQDPDNPYRYLAIRGRVEEVTEAGADAHIDALSKKYLGEDTYRAAFFQNRSLTSRVLAAILSRKQEVDQGGDAIAAFWCRKQHASSILSGL